MEETCELCSGKGYYLMEYPNEAGDDMVQVEKKCVCQQAKDDDNYANGGSEDR